MLGVRRQKNRRVSFEGNVMGPKARQLEATWKRRTNSSGWRRVGKKRVMFVAGWNDGDSRQFCE